MNDLQMQVVEGYIERYTSDYYIQTVYGKSVCQYCQVMENTSGTDNELHLNVCPVAVFLQLKTLMDAVD